jgi:hypothetical protein
MTSHVAGLPATLPRHHARDTRETVAPRDDVASFGFLAATLAGGVLTWVLVLFTAYFAR